MSDSHDELLEAATERYTKAEADLRAAWRFIFGDDPVYVVERVGDVWNVSWSDCMGGGFLSEHIRRRRRRSKRLGVLRTKQVAPLSQEKPR